MTEHMTLVDRLASLSNLEKIPRAELEWLAAHGRLQRHEVGNVLSPKGKRIENLYVILSGHVAVRVDRGAGPRRVMGWRTGEVSGMLPYSRMKGPPGDNYLEEPTEVLAIHEDHFPEMICECPVFTTYTVHLMLDRARSFNTSDLQDEKMISLGRMAAGLAHELNNPASAMVRGAKQLSAELAQAEAAAYALCAAGLSDEHFAWLEGMRATCLMQPDSVVLSPIQQADREDDIRDWLVSRALSPEDAESLANTAVTIGTLDALAEATSGETLDAVLRWIVAGCGTHSLASDMEQAATRIYELVAAVKRFTYMDNLAGPEPVDVEGGLSDTLKVLAAKAKSRGAAIKVDIAPDLPRVYATGSELNQVWLNLIDNALDAIAESGTIEICGRHEVNRVVVRVIDDGPGIPEEILPHIFDLFFTTKPPGQGTGLGLDITRRLLRRYHGDIAVESRPGRTEFRVVLTAESPATSAVDQSTEAVTAE